MCWNKKLCSNLIGSIQDLSFFRNFAHPHNKIGISPLTESVFPDGKTVERVICVK